MKWIAKLQQTMFSQAPGFTFIEIVVVMAIVATFAGLIITNLSSLQNHSYLSSAVTTLLSDIKEQQTKAMVGDTEGSGTTSAYGLYYAGNSYVLFPGTTYSAGNSRNITIQLDGTLQFVGTGSIVFDRLSGKVDNYNAASHTITLQDTNTGDQRVIDYNQVGVITNVN